VVQGKKNSFKYLELFFGTHDRLMQPTKRGTTHDRQGSVTKALFVLRWAKIVIKLFNKEDDAGSDVDAYNKLTERALPVLHIVNLKNNKIIFLLEEYENNMLFHYPHVFFKDLQM